MTAREKLDEYWFLLKYVIFRNTEHHFADANPFGYIVPAFAVIPLFVAKTRRIAVMLWGSILSWLVIPLFVAKTRRIAVMLWGSILSWLVVVAMNAQVRWQNERYTMPAVAWVLLLAAFGVALLLEPPVFARGFSLASIKSKQGALFGAR